MFQGNDGASLVDGFRLPPQNLEAERGVLGGAMLDGRVLHDVVTEVDAGDFYRAAHETVYQAIRNLYDDGRRVDATTVSEELARLGKLGEVGGVEYLAEVINGVPHAAHAKAYAQIVKQKAIARRLIEAHTAALADCYSNNFTAEELAARSEGAIFAVSDGSARAGEHSPLADATTNALASLDARSNGEVLGLGTGILELDAITDGWRPGQVVIVAARPSMGKTALALNFADAAATDQAAPTLFVSLEMSRDELGERYLAMRGRVDGYRLKNPEGLTPADMGRLGRAHDDARRSRMVIDDSPAMNVTQLGASARRVKAKHGLSLLIVDYLQLVDGPRLKGENREQEVARVSRRLKAIGRELKVPVVVLAQLNRQSEGRDGHRPRLSDLRESGQIEQDADVVMLLHRPEYYDPNDQPGIAELIVAKNRNGRTGTVRLTFHRHLTRFEPVMPDAPTAADF